MPGAPTTVYGSEWEGWGVFLGTGAVRGRIRPWMDFEDAREWAHQSGATSDHEWRALVKSKEFPKDIPKSPAYVYRNQWQGWGDWLGTGNEVGGGARWRKVRGQCKRVP